IDEVSAIGSPRLSAAGNHSLTVVALIGPRLPDRRGFLAKTGRMSGFLLSLAFRFWSLRAPDWTSCPVLLDPTGALLTYRTTREREIFHDTAADQVLLDD